MHVRFLFVAACAATMSLAGCASLPADRGYAEAAGLVQTRIDAMPAWSAESIEASSVHPDVPTAPLTSEQAVLLAFAHNPRIRSHYARLGLGRAELAQASRLANPSFGFARRAPHPGSGAEISRSLSLGFTDLLLLPARKRFASAELERLQLDVATELLNLAADVEHAWLAAVSAQQVAAMRDLVAQAAGHSAELAQRFFDAGNISRLQLEQERAAAAQARIAAVRATASALRDRGALAGLIGLPVDAPWTTSTALPAPFENTLVADDLVALALTQRLDLAALRKEVAMREDTLGVTRRWRWLGSVEAGYEYESEIAGGHKRGPSLALELPIFQQGQASIMRAQAELTDARARLDGLLLSAHNDSHAALGRLVLNREIAEHYRSMLVPRREAIVALSQEQVNFMLKGVFELIAVKQQEYDAYQEYLEAVRDYWLARVDLRRAVGGRLPDDGVASESTPGIDAILPGVAKPAMDHSMHHIKAEDAATESATDPHAGHDMKQHDADAPSDAEHSADKPAHQHGDTP